MPLEYTPQFIKKEYIPTENVGLISNILAQKQNRYDKAVDYEDKALGSLYNLQTTPGFQEARNKMIEGIGSKLQEAIDRKGGDAGAAFNDIKDIITNVGSDKFFQLNRIANEQAGYLNQLKAKNPNLMVLNDPGNVKYTNDLTAEDLNYSVLDPERFSRELENRYGYLRNKRIGTRKEVADGYDVLLTEYGLSDSEKEKLKKGNDFKEMISGIKGINKNPEAIQKLKNIYDSKIESLNGRTSERFGDSLATKMANYNRISKKSTSTGKSIKYRSLPTQNLTFRLDRNFENAKDVMNAASFSKNNSASKNSLDESRKREASNIINYANPEGTFNEIVKNSKENIINSLDNISRVSMPKIADIVYTDPELAIKNIRNINEKLFNDRENALEKEKSKRYYGKKSPEYEIARKTGESKKYSNIIKSIDDKLNEINNLNENIYKIQEIPNIKETSNPIEYINDKIKELKKVKTLRGTDLVGDAYKELRENIAKRENPNNLDIKEWISSPEHKEYDKYRKYYEDQFVKEQESHIKALELLKDKIKENVKSYMDLSKGTYAVRAVTPLEKTADIANEYLQNGFNSFEVLEKDNKDGEYHDKESFMKDNSISDIKVSHIASTTDGELKVIAHNKAGKNITLTCNDDVIAKAMANIVDPYLASTVGHSKVGFSGNWITDLDGRQIKKLPPDMYIDTKTTTVDGDTRKRFYLRGKTFGDYWLPKIEKKARDLAYDENEKRESYGIEKKMSIEEARQQILEDSEYLNDIINDGKLLKSPFYYDTKAQIADDVAEYEREQKNKRIK